MYDHVPEGSNISALERKHIVAKIRNNTMPDPVEPKLTGSNWFNEFQTVVSNKCLIFALYMKKVLYV